MCPILRSFLYSYDQIAFKLRFVGFLSKSISFLAFYFDKAAHLASSSIHFFFLILTKLTQKFTRNQKHNTSKLGERDKTGSPVRYSFRCLHLRISSIYVP